VTQRHAAPGAVANPERTRQSLIFDADDTLWENNVLFNRVIDDFIGWLAHPSLDRREVRAILADIERANVAVHGYGTRVFLRSLGDCFAQLAMRPASAADTASITELAADLLAGRIELIAAVSATLADLGQRHDLYLMTKGDQGEQQRKIDASGLAHHFRGVDIVAEKNAEAYLRAVERYRLAPERSWMIGNSPKSDIVAAREAGLNAVFIPNVHTWELESAPIDESDARILRLGSFGELTRHF
jgi:putative hydrolase of the HAD superfamily